MTAVAMQVCWHRPRGSSLSIIVVAPSFRGSMTFDKPLARLPGHVHAVKQQVSEQSGHGNPGARDTHCIHN